MSHRKKKNEDEDKSSESGLGAAVATGAAVVGFAALAYGAWKLYDLFSSASEGAAATASPDAEAKSVKKIVDSEDEEDTNSSPVRRRNGSNVTALKGGSKNSPSKSEDSLTNQLLSYYKSYVDVEPLEMREAMKTLKAVKVGFSQHLWKNKIFKELLMCQMEETGSSTDGLMVVFPENFDVLIPFQLDPEKCCIDLHESMNQCSSVLLKTANDSWSKVRDDDDYLVPSKFIEILKDDFEDAVGDCTIDCLKPMIHETRLTVDVCREFKKFSINFIPALRIGTREFVAEKPDVEKLSGPFQWRESFNLLETQRMNQLSGNASGHKVILKIFKAIRLNFPLQFGLLSSYHYKTVLLHLMDFQTNASDWETSAISERFIDFLIDLGSCLKDRNLPHYFVKQCNLLEGLSPDTTEKLAHFVNQIVGHHDISSLLKSDYPQH